MYLFYDAEFTSLEQDADLISIGIIAANGNKFYAEFTDYSKAKAKKNEAFLNESVFPNLYLTPELEKFDLNDTKVLGNTEKIKKELATWLLQFDLCEIVSDVGAYDFVFFAQIFGGAIKLPPNVSPSFIEFNTLLMKYFKVNSYEAFDMNREVLAKINPDEVKNKHNSLYDAIVCKRISDIYSLL